jgi:hypothetical protein
MCYPFGIANIKRWDMIDLDEAGINLLTADQKVGLTLASGHSSLGSTAGTTS